MYSRYRKILNRFRTGIKTATRCIQNNIKSICTTFSGQSNITDFYELWGYFIKSTINIFQTSRRHTHNLIKVIPVIQILAVLIDVLDLLIIYLFLFLFFIFIYLFYFCLCMCVCVCVGGGGLRGLWVTSLTSRFPPQSYHSDTSIQCFARPHMLFLSNIIGGSVQLGWYRHLNRFTY